MAELERATRVELALAHLQWGPDLVEAYRRAGRHAVASRELEALEEHARVAGLAPHRAATSRCRILVVPGELEQPSGRRCGG